MENIIIKNEEKALTFASSGLSMKEIFGDDIDGMNLKFDRIKIPSGGGIAFEMPSDDPNSPDLLKEFKAVIVYHHVLSSYYTDKFSGGNQPPQCSSTDGKKGVDYETGEIKICSECEYNEFGSGENGAKACKQKRRIFLLREGELLPTILNIPTGSLSDFNSYIQRLLKKGKKSANVVTKFSLKKVQNKSGISYSQVTCAVDRELTLEEIKAVSIMATEVKEFAFKVSENSATE